MLRHSYFCVVICIVSLCTSSINADAKTRKVSLRKAISGKLVHIKAFSRGTTGQNALKLQLTNTGADTLLINVEPALLFKPEDTTTQPLVTQGDEVIALNAQQQKEVILDAYCGNSGASCPRMNGNYTFSRQLDTNLVGILRYAKSNSLPYELRQSAVWLFTNHHSLASVYAPYSPLAAENYIKYIAAKLKMKSPNAYIHYSIDSSGHGPMVRKGYERVYVNMSWDQTKAYRNVYVSVCKPDGTLYKRVENGFVTDTYGTTVVVPFSPLRDPPGTHIVMVHDDSRNILQQKTVELGGDVEQY